MARLGGRRQAEDMTDLVLGGAGKTGRRGVERPETLGLPVGVGSRNGTPPFDRDDERATRAAASGMGSGS